VTSPQRAPDRPYPGITYVIPCGGQKVDRPAAARDLYVGQMFRHTLASALECARLDTAELGVPARVVVLSGRYGLVELDDILEPYEQRIDKPGAVTTAVIAEQAKQLGIDWQSQVYALLPRPYLRKLDEALRPLDVYVQDVYEACAGIGEQRRVNAHITRPTAAPTAEPVAAGEGLRVWIGGDVHAFWWDPPQQLLVSYDRLAEVKVLPVARAPWVLDSGAYRQLDKHGTWTVSAAQYAADIARFAVEIGRLEWAVCQDWPAGAKALQSTGLTEFDHQIRTTASVKDLRALCRTVPILPVVTATTAAGYLRHVDMYRRAGIDLRSEPLVGVGALLGRPVREAAEIVRVLHGAGLTRLHAFGGKGRLLELVGDLLTSTDSMGWSDDARRSEDLCPHGVVRWERNCPHAAVRWAQRQRDAGSRGAACVQLGLDLWAPVLDELNPI
jgi:hypothetical protein